MSQLPHTGRSGQEYADRALLGRGTILILSGYLLGTATAHAFSSMIEACAIGAGVIGMLAYLVLTTASRRRQSQESEQALQKAALELERRIARHARRESMGFALKWHLTHQQPHEQYLTVVQSARTIR